MEAEAASHEEVISILEGIARGERPVETELRGCAQRVRLAGPRFWSRVPDVVLQEVLPARTWGPLAFNYHAYQVVMMLASGRLPEDKYRIEGTYSIKEGRAELRVKRLSEATV